MCREESKMAKPLWEFVEKRMKELGMTRYDLETENDIAYATVQRLKAGSTNIKDSTKQKLALALKCSVGDINNAIYNQVASAPEAAGEPSVMETVDKLEKIIRKEHPDALCLGAGGCRVCRQCSYPEPCRFPDRAVSSMEGYGLFVTQVCRDAGAAYHHGDRTITYTACVLF